MTSRKNRGAARKVMRMNKSRTFSTNIDVRFRDMDALGHVNHAVFFTYFEEGRKIFFQNHFEISSPAGFGLIIAHISCDYLKPIKLTDRLKLYITVGSIKNKSFSFNYKLADRKDDSVVFATGVSVQVCYDFSLNKSVPVPAEFKEKLVNLQPRQ
ncbi:MAG: thioesterase family protein [Thermodesulfobacteriota bacterium]